MMSYFRGREARAATWRWNVLKTFSQTIVFWSIFLFILPTGIVAIESALGLEGWRFTSTIGAWCGGLLFVLGGVLGLTSGAVMAVRGRGTPLPADCPRALVVVGPYRYLRNPMAVAGLTQGVAVGVALGSPAVVAYALVGGPIWHFFVRPWEEQDLQQRFGEEYKHYRSQVRCWLPRFPGYSSSADVLQFHEYPLPRSRGELM